jgi:hypothetical protein
MNLGFTSLGSKEQRARNKDVINPTPPTSSGQSKQWYNSEIQVFAPCSLNAEAKSMLYILSVPNGTVYIQSESGELFSKLRGEITNLSNFEALA